MLKDLLSIPDLGGIWNQLLSLDGSGTEPGAGETDRHGFCPHKREEGVPGVSPEPGCHPSVCQGSHLCITSVGPSVCWGVCWPSALQRVGLRSEVQSCVGASLRGQSGISVFALQGPPE